MTGTSAFVELPGAADRLPRRAQPMRDVAVLVRRNLIHIAREPMRLSDVTIQPVLFTLLLIFVFGSGVPIRGGSYTDFALAGLLTMNLVTSAIGTAVGLSTDLSTGLIDRLRTLPIWRSSILAARAISDVMTAALCAAAVALTGLAVGWRPDAALVSVAAGFGVALLFSFAVSWALGCAGLVARSAESAASLGFILLFPLAFVSNAMVPTQGMPGWLRLIADWNPVSAVTAAARQLFGNPNPSAMTAVWPMQHPVAAALGWSAVILALSLPLAPLLFRRRTSD